MKEIKTISSDVCTSTPEAYSNLCTKIENAIPDECTKLSIVGKTKTTTWYKHENIENLYLVAFRNSTGIYIGPSKTEPQNDLDYSTGLDDISFLYRTTITFSNISLSGQYQYSLTYALIKHENIFAMAGSDYLSFKSAFIFIAKGSCGSYYMNASLYNNQIYSDNGSLYQVMQMLPSWRLGYDNACYVLNAGLSRDGRIIYNETLLGFVSVMANSITAGCSYKINDKKYIADSANTMIQYE